MNPVPETSQPVMDDTLPGVLLVDDEPQVLAGLALQLGRRFRLTTAASGPAGLDAFRREKPMVVVSDMYMPGMDGATFLKRVREIDPTAVRMLLTGSADFGSAVGAVNEGYVFRFLTKPCPRETFGKAIDDAVEQYRLVTRDRALMERRLESLSAQLLHAERLATLGTMLSGVGHELNNVLAVLMPTVQLMEKRLDAGQPVERADLERLGRVGGHLRTHLRHLLNFGRSEAEPEEILDLRNVVRTTLDLLRVAGKVKHLDVEVDFPDLPLPVKTSRTRLEQVLVNLIGNAADAVSEAGLPEGRLGVRAGLESPSAVWCSIEDHGCGIPEDKLEAIFQPYYTTKPPGRGTGLGLPVVKRLVESYGGSISVKSEPGRGTKVRFELPLFREGDAVSGNEIRDQAGGVEPPPVHDGQVPQPQVGAIAQAPSR